MAVLTPKQDQTREPAVQIDLTSDIPTLSIPEEQDGIWSPTKWLHCVQSTAQDGDSTDWESLLWEGYSPSRPNMNLLFNI